MIASTQTNHPLGRVASARTQRSLLDAACERLKAAGMRITQPRIAILSVLIGNNKPVPIEQLHAELKEASCDLVTVYRCLAAFEEIGLVRRCFFHNGTSLYQLVGDAPPAYHVVDKETNEIVKLDAATSAELAASLKRVEETLRARGYKDVTHLVEFLARNPKATTTRPANKRAATPPAPTRSGILPDETR